MLLQLKGRILAAVSSWTYLLFIIGIFLLSEPQSQLRINLLVVASVFSLISAFLLYSRIRLIEDTTDTSLNSAAQGYVELKGIVQLYEKEIIRGAEVELPPMVWYRNFLKTSSAGFILKDDKGRCTIDPRNAEVITPLYSYNNKYYHSIYPGESIYVLGQLETLKKHKNAYEIDGLIRSKVIDWKKNQYAFMDYFDSNQDGKIDDAEMDFAKDAAAREVDADLEADYQKPPTHVISFPEDGRPFILSSIHPDALLCKYNSAMIIHLFIWVYLSVLVLLG